MKIRLISFIGLEEELGLLRILQNVGLTDLCVELMMVRKNSIDIFVNSIIYFKLGKRYIKIENVHEFLLTLFEKNFPGHVKKYKFVIVIQLPNHIFQN